MSKGAPVGHTCPMIDAMIRSIREACDAIDATAYQLEDSSARNEIESKTGDIRYEIEGRRSSIEDIRSANEALRKWGESLEERVDELENDVRSLQEELERIQAERDQAQYAHKTCIEEYDKLLRETHTQASATDAE